MGIILVLGGTKTGKTTFAENRAKKLSKPDELPVYYIATARAIDSEMVNRIRKHKEKRPSHWKTIEEPLCVSKVLGSLKEQKSIIILDCLTLLMTNILFEKGEDCHRDLCEKSVFDEIDRIVQESKDKNEDLIIISNQVENGLVSEHAWARMFQDITGMAHQKLAAAADHVFMMNAGLAQQLK